MKCSHRSFCRPAEYVPAGLSFFRVIWPKFDEATFNFAIHGLANEPAFLGRTVVVWANAGATFVGSDDRIAERALGEPVEMTAENGLEV
jgi:hypothetical protein